MIYSTRIDVFSIVRPKRRHLVVADFIRACAEEDTLLDEDGELEDFEVHIAFGTYSSTTRICPMNNRRTWLCDLDPYSHLK